MSNYHQLLASSLCAFSTLVCVSQAGADPILISVDLQSSYDTQGRAFSGVDPEAAAADPFFAAAAFWNVIGTTGFTVLTDVAGLKDSTGATTTVGFKTSGHGAYGDASFGPSDLLNDYFYWGSRGASPNLEWEINGLIPNGIYVFFANGSNSDADAPRVFLMTLDTDGDGDLSDETAVTVVSPSGTLFPKVVAGANGKIVGRGTKVGNVEPNWGGFQLAGPFPSDSDDDGVPDAQDECPSSILTSTIKVGQCDTGLANPVDESGCTLADKLNLGHALQQAATGARNHGAFVRRMAQYLNTKVKSGVITREQHEAIMSCVGPANESQFTRN